MAAKNGGNGVSKQQQKDYAKLLYTTGDWTQKEIAAKVGVSENTISTWARDGMWQYLTKSLITSKSDQIRRLYEIANSVTTKIESTEGGYGDTKLADMMIKYTAAIGNLETDTSAGQMFETGMLFIRFVSKENFELAKEITNYFDAFIQQELNKKF